MDLDPDNPLTAEIRQEMAHAYFASLRKMADAIAALKEFDQENRSPNLPTDIQRRSQLLDAASERIHFVLIQREAMKLPWHDTFFDDYDIPQEIRFSFRQA